MVQWNSNVDSMFFKVVLKIHDIKVDYKRAEEALRAEGIDVTAKALMHRITKLKATQADPAASPGKASPVKAAKRAADGKPKSVIPDPEDGEPGEAIDDDVKTTLGPKAKKPRTVKAKPAAAAAAEKGSGKAKKGAATAAAGKKAKQEDTDDEEMVSPSLHDDDDDGDEAI